MWNRPAVCLIAPLLTALISITLMVAFAAVNWQRGNDSRKPGGIHFGERMIEGPVREPANTWSNLGFVVAGMAIGWRAMNDWRSPSFTPGVNLIHSDPFFPASLAAVAVFLGPASAAMHASGTRWGGRVDVFSMFLWATWGVAYHFTQLMRGQRNLFLVVYGILILMSVARIFFNVNPLDIGSNETFGLLIVLGLGLGIAARWDSSSTADLKALLSALGAFLVAFGVFWIPNVKGLAFCHPKSSIPGHAIWHLLCAVSVWFVYVYLRSERPGLRQSTEVQGDKVDWQAAILVLPLVISFGCGPRMTLATANIAGMVRIDGKVLESGTISFVPRQKTDGAAVTVELQEGRYQATVPKGSLQVLLFATAESGRTILELGQPVPERVNLIPEAYRDGWSIEVQGDNPAQDFELKSR
jgi:hypothetical protein